VKRNIRIVGGFPLTIEMSLCGFLFWLDIILVFASERFGYITYNELDSDAKLPKIHDDPKKFEIGFVLILMEHFNIIALATMLFIAFGSYSLILGIVWIIFRTGEGLIQIYYRKNYWGLLNIARQYPGTSGAEKNALIDLGRSILQTKSSSFSFAQILFSIGTLTYSILFITYEVVPAIFGWFGIVASILYGFGNGIILVKPNFKVPAYFGGLLIFLFEGILGGWLIFSSII
jgi:hypothetical protein